MLWLGRIELLPLEVNSRVRWAMVSCREDAMQPMQCFVQCEWEV